MYVPPAFDGRSGSVGFTIPELLICPGVPPLPPLPIITFHISNGVTAKG